MQAKFLCGTSRKYLIKERDFSPLPPYHFPAVMAGTLAALLEHEDLEGSKVEGTRFWATLWSCCGILAF